MPKAKAFTLEQFQKWGAAGGKIGGKSKSKKKQRAIRANGKRGGRPRKEISGKDWKDGDLLELEGNENCQRVWTIFNEEKKGNITSFLLDVLLWRHTKRYSRLP